MNNTAQLLEQEIYPRLFSDAISVFPEMEFELYRGNYRSKLKLFGEISNKSHRKDKTVITRKNPYCLLEQGGEVVNFWNYIKRRDNLTTNKSVLETLAKFANYNLPTLDKGYLEAIEKAQKISAIYESINTYFLHALPQNSDVVNYLHAKSDYYVKNSLAIELGFFKGNLNDLRLQLKETYTKEEINKALSIFSNPSIGQYHTLSLPYRDKYGRIKGFSFRNIHYTPTSTYPKYLYTGGAFRSSILFNLTPIKSEQEAVLVESPMDAKLCNSFDFDVNVIALGGTTINQTQVDLLKEQGFKRITLALDNDDEGKKATLKALELLSKNNFDNIYFTQYDKVKDLGELFESGGEEAVQTAIKGAVSIARFLVFSLTQKYAEIQEATGLTDKIIEELKKEILTYGLWIKDVFEQERFKTLINSYFKEIGITEKALQEKGEELRKALEHEKLKTTLQKINKAQQEAINRGDIASYKTLEQAVKNALVQAKTTDYRKLLHPLNESKLKEVYASSPDSLNIGLTLTNDHQEEVTVELPSNALSYIVAPTSHGKTMALVNFMLQAVINHQDKSFYFFVLEGAKEDILLRFLNCYANLNLSKNNVKTLESYFRGQTEYVKKELVEDFEGLKNKFFQTFIETNRINVIDDFYYSNELIEAIEFLNKERNVGGVFIDYIQLIRHQKEQRSRQEELKQIGLDFVELANKTKLPLCFAAQFNREVKNEIDLSPYRIGEAGDLERQASLLIGLFNRFKAGTSDKEEIVIRLMKRRKGNPRANDIFTFNGNTGKINLDKTAYNGDDDFFIMD